MEESAVSVLKRAVELDEASRYQESFVCYQEGVALLLKVLRENELMNEDFSENGLKKKNHFFTIHVSYFLSTATKDEKKKNHYKDKISSYIDRAEYIKKYIEKEKEEGKYHKQIKIEENMNGFSYEKLFQEYLDNTVTEVWVEDPYIRQVHQLYNFLRFCEMLVKGPCKVKRIHLLTSHDEGNKKNQQMKILEEIEQSLKGFSVTLDVLFSPSIHDREIRFNNGWVIKIGRGLDYFKKPQGSFCIGYCDFDLRPCHETTVDIFHSKHMKKM